MTMIVVISSHPWEFRVSHIRMLYFCNAPENCSFWNQSCRTRTQHCLPEDVNHVTCDAVVFNAAMSACERGTTWQATKSARAKWKPTGVMAWQRDFTNLDTLPKNDVARDKTDTQDSKKCQSFVARTTWSNRATWHAWSCSRSRYLMIFHTEGQTKCTVKTASPAWLPTGVPGLAWEDEWEGYSKGKTGIALKKTWQVAELYTYTSIMQIHSFSLHGISVDKGYRAGHLSAACFSVVILPGCGEL